MRATPNDRGLGPVSVVLLIGLFFVTPIRADADHDHSAESTSPGQQVQTECPVMVGNEIDPDLYTVYRDKKVFFCCQFCKTEFEKNPEKYLPRLPQFPSAAADGHAENGHANHDYADTRGFLAQLIKPMGILTLSLVAVTVALGVLRRRWKPRLMLKIHKICGVWALVAGAVHAALVVFLH